VEVGSEKRRPRILRRQEDAIDPERTCPGVGREWIRVLLAKLKKSGKVTCHGKGPAARWFYRRK